MFVTNYLSIRLLVILFLLRALDTSSRTPEISRLHKMEFSLTGTPRLLPCSPTLRGLVKFPCSLEQKDDCHCMKLIFEDHFSRASYCRRATWGWSGWVEEAINVFSDMTQKNTVTDNSMICVFAKNGRIRDARKLFVGMLHRNLVSWNAMVAGYLHNDRVKEVYQLFEKMHKRNRHS